MQTGATLTITAPSLTQSQAAEQQVSVFAAGATGSNLAGVYTVNSSQGAVTITPTGTAASAVPQNPSSTDGGVTGLFAITDAKGSTAQFTVTYNNGALSIQPANQAALSLMTEAGQELITGTGLIAAQTEMGITMNQVQVVYLEQTITGDTAD